MVSKTVSLFSSFALIKDTHLGEKIQSGLSDLGFTIFVASDSRAVIEHFKTQNFDLFLCDLEEDEKEIFPLLMDFTKTYPDVPIVVMTSFSHHNLLYSLRLGAWDFIEKPIHEMSKIEYAICKSLERARLVNENRMYRYQLEKTNQKLEQSLAELKQDQLAGRKIQKQLFPKKEMVIENYHYSSRVYPSLYLSGDSIDYFKISDHKIGFYIADVSGHGASSAFVTVMCKVLFDQLLLAYKQTKASTIFQPGNVLTLANQYLYKSKINKYATFFYGVLDTQTNQLTYCIAGHYPFPMISSEKGTKWLADKNYPVGMLGDVIYEDKTVPFPENGLLTLFSDGLLEVMEEDNLAFKEKHLLGLINSEMSLETFIEKIKLRKNMELIDDVTLLFVKRLA